MPARVAQPDDLDEVTATIAGAFAGDPLWSWAVPDLDRRARLWRFFVQGALCHPNTYIADGGRAVAMWIPPGGSELSHEQEEQLPDLIGELCGARAADVLVLLDRFEEAHPTAEPHYYLSLLGTHPEHRGGGIGMALLAENLAAFDADGIPTYLESSNPDNVPRYERIGYRPVGSFTTPDDSRTVTTMWRDARDG